MFLLAPLWFSQPWFQHLLPLLVDGLLTLQEQRLEGEVPLPVEPSRHHLHAWRLWSVTYRQEGFLSQSASCIARHHWASTMVACDFKWAAFRSWCQRREIVFYQTYSSSVSRFLFASVSREEICSEYYNALSFCHWLYSLSFWGGSGHFGRFCLQFGRQFHIGSPGYQVLGSTV